MIVRSTARFTVSSFDGQCVTYCVMVVAAVAGLETSIRTGSFWNCLASLVISGGIVAENSSVWRVLGSSVQIFSMSGMNPMSSIRSASSMTSICTPVINRPPRPKWSIRRPGVAISTSAPALSFFSWSPNDTPPISSAMVSL